MTKKQHFYSLLATMMAAYTPNNANAEQRYINCQENDINVYDYSGISDILSDMKVWTKQDFLNADYDTNMACNTEDINWNRYDTCPDLNKEFLIEQLCPDQNCIDYLNGDLICIEDCGYGQYFHKQKKQCTTCPKYCVGTKCISATTNSDSAIDITECYIPNDTLTGLTDESGTYNLNLANCQYLGSE